MQFTLITRAMLWILINLNTNLIFHFVYSGAQKGRNDFVSKITNKVVSSFLGTTVSTVMAV